MRPIRFKCEFYVLSLYIWLSEIFLRDFDSNCLHFIGVTENKGKPRSQQRENLFRRILWFFPLFLCVATKFQGGGANIDPMVSFFFLPITRKCLYSIIYVWWGEIHQKKLVCSSVYTNRRMFLIACYLCWNLRRV